jgi:anti-sigma regulatory factor (Ser/Thr protein kinase)
VAKRMADDQPAGELTAPVLDLAFDSGTLDALRAGVKAHACQAGLPENRVEDLVLAVHELAANAVHHGAGAGRLRIWRRVGALHCQVEDGDPLVASGQVSVYPLFSRPGHGLWVVRQLADRMRVLRGVRGTRATVTFNLPRRPSPGCLPI